MAANVSWKDTTDTVWLDTTDVVWFDYDPHVRPNVTRRVPTSLGSTRDTFRKPYLFGELDDEYTKMMNVKMDAETGGFGSTGEKYLEFKKPYLCGMEQLMSAQYSGKEGEGATKDIWKPYYPECEANVLTKLIGQRPPSRALPSPGAPYLPGDVPEPTRITGTAGILGETEVNVGDVDVYSPFGTAKPPFTWGVIGGIIVNGFDPYRQYIEWTDVGIQIVLFEDSVGRKAGLAVDVAAAEGVIFFYDPFDDLTNWPTTFKANGDETVEISGGRLHMISGGVAGFRNSYIRRTEEDTWPINWRYTFTLEYISGSYPPDQKHQAFIDMYGTLYRLFIVVRPPDTFRIQIRNGVAYETVVVDNFMNQAIEMRIEADDDTYTVYWDDVEIHSGLLSETVLYAGRMNVGCYCNDDPGLANEFYLDNIKIVDLG